MRCDRGICWFIVFCCLLAHASFVEGACALPLLSVYEFDGDLTDSRGNGADLVSIGGGGTLSSGSFAFGLNDGLRLSTDVTSSDFCIEMNLVLSPDNFSGLDKLLDFQSLSNFQGLYINSNSKLIFSPGSAGSDDVSSTATIGLSRFGNDVKISIDGVVDSSFTDAGKALTTATGELHFFLLDSPRSSETGASGSVSEIRVYAVPEPSPFLFLGLLTVGTGFLRWMTLVVPANRQLESSLS